MSSAISEYRLELLITNENATQYYQPNGRQRYTHNPENAGIDLYCMTSHEYTATPALVPLGVKARLVKLTEDGPVDVHYWLLPRSSIIRSGFMMANSVGIIDKSYRGELMAPVISVGENRGQTIVPGTRLFQIVAPDMGWIREVVFVSQLSETHRGEGGFGSTGTGVQSYA
jgi:deoxyuridine 5'-triphosphate nucleotidohydrolase